jgi:serine/threonine protein kinase
MVDVGASGHLRPGTVLIGKYEILRPIGRGGFGLVYEAWHRGLGASVAVKVLTAEGRQNPKTIARFRQEASAAARIASENVVRVTDIDVLEDGAPFLVMELLVGRDLERELKVRGRLPPREAVDYVLQAAAGLREAHRHGVVHRDLKTSNLFLVEEPGGRRVKVLDFGLSKLAASLGMTSTNATIGTPLYTAPEQLQSAKSADARADIWSLGVITYQMLSGRLPFQGQSVAEVMLQIMSGEPAELGLVAPDVPAGLCAAVARALEKKPERRFRSMEAFAEAMAPFASPNLAGAIASTRRPDAHPAEPRPSSTFLDSSQDTPPERGTSRVWTGVGLAAAAVLVTLAAGLHFGGHLLAPKAGQGAPGAASLKGPEPRPASSGGSAPSASAVPSGVRFGKSTPSARPKASRRRAPAELAAPHASSARSNDLGF